MRPLTSSRNTLESLIELFIHSQVYFSIARENLAFVSISPATLYAYRSVAGIFFSSTAPVHTCVLPIQIIYSKEKVEFWRELFRISFFVSVSQRCSLFAQSKSSLWVVLRSTPLCVSDAHNLPKGKIQTTASICSPSDCKLPSHSCFSLFLFGELSSRYYAELCMILLFFITRTKYNTFNPKSRRVRR